MGPARVIALKNQRQKNSYSH